MSPFTSKRERNLWLSTGIVLISIYATLGLAGILAEQIQNRGVLNGAYLLLAGLTLVVFLTQGLKTRPGGMDIAIAIGMVVIFSMVVVRMGISVTERTHLFEYGLVATFIFQALAERAQNNRAVPHLALITIGATAFFGLLDEGIQAILPNRVFDIRDVAFNAIAAVIAVCFSLLLTQARKWIDQRRRSK